VQPGQPLRIGVFLFEGCEELDWAGPWEVLSYWARSFPDDRVEVFTLAQSLEREGPMVVVNIGGVSNITYIDGADTLIACDTGPGNALLDDFIFRATGQRFDCEGRMAAQGKASGIRLRPDSSG